MHLIHCKIETTNVIQNCHTSHTKWQICMTSVANLYDIHTFDITGCSRMVLLMAPVDEILLKIYFNSAFPSYLHIR